MEFKVGDRVRIDKNHSKYKSMRCSMKNYPHSECETCLYYRKNIDNSIFTIKVADRDLTELAEKYLCNSSRSLFVFPHNLDMFKKAYKWIKMKGPKDEI